MKNTNLMIGGIVLVLVIIIVFLLKAHILTSPFNIPSLKLKKEAPVILLDELNDSGIKGSVQVKEEKSKAKVLVTLAGVKEGDDIYMHIHEGECPEVGKILYDLNTLKDGSSETPLEISVKELKEKLPLAVNIHTLEGENEVEVACGNIE